MSDLTTIAWATLPLDGKHRPRWSKEHLVNGAADIGAKTLCGLLVPHDAFDIDRSGGQQDWCLACQRWRRWPQGLIAPKPELKGEGEML